MAHPPPPSAVRLAEVVGALARATDLGSGQTVERSLRACVLAMRFGQLLGMADDLLHDLYYVVLLRWIGDAADVQGGDTSGVVGWSWTSLDRVALWSGAGMLQLRWGTMDTDPSAFAPLHRQMDMPETFQRATPGAPLAYGTAAQRIAQRLGLREQISHALGHLFARWDGGERLALPIRVAQIALDAELLHRLGGVELAIDVVCRRSGTVYDPEIALSFCRAAHELFPALACDSVWQLVLVAEPGVQVRLTGAALESALEVIGDVADLHTYGTVGHARAVATLAASAAEQYALPDADRTILRYAGLIQDIGMLASTQAFGATALCSDAEQERERMRLHPYYTERILARSPALAPIGALASLHHERLDGSGYYRGLSAAQLSSAARILAVADVYAALTKVQPHQTAIPPTLIAEKLRNEVRAGRLDDMAVHAVLAAAGQRIRRRLPTRIAGLTNREIEVLRLLSEGLVNHQMAERLCISTHTVDRHIEHIYDKIDVSTRAEAVRFAMQQQLLGPWDTESAPIRAKK